MPLNTEVLRQVAARYDAPADLLRAEASLVLLINALLGLTKVHERHRRQLIDTAVWKYTEAAGMRPHPKYNLRYVTDGARNLEVPTPVQHEHVWERSRIIGHLMEGVPWAEDGLKAFLATHAVACTVTQEEHALLEPGSGWERYAHAGIPVWDRQEHTYLRVGEAIVAPPRSFEEPPAISPALLLDLSRLIEERATTAAPYLHKLVKSAQFMSAVAVPAVDRSGQPTNYFRIHDALLDQPSAAVAYPHWTGKVDFWLSYEQVPMELRGPAVRELQTDKYAVTCRVIDEPSLAAAEELLFLSLQNLRDAADET